MEILMDLTNDKVCYFHSVLEIKVRLERFLHRAAGEMLPYG